MVLDESRLGVYSRTHLNIIGFILIDLGKMLTTSDSERDTTDI